MQENKAITMPDDMDPHIMTQAEFYDVAVIGAGVIGAMIARELSKYRVKVVLLDKESDVATETSSANSGIVHAGYDAVPGSKKAILNVEGTRQMEQVAKELDAPFTRTGSLVLAFNDMEMDKLNYLMDQGRKNGVPDLRILSGDAVRAMEPAVSPAVVGALHAPTAGIVCPYQLTVGAVENAVGNGVALKRGWPVRRIQRLREDAAGFRNAAAVNVAGTAGITDSAVTAGITDSAVTAGITDSAVTAGITDSAGTAASRLPRFRLMSDSMTLTARFVVNAAGLYADDVAAMVGDGYFRIHPRKGEYLLLDRQLGKTVHSVVFQAPGPMGKGILVAPTADGNLLLGPNALDVPDKSDTETSFEGLRKVAEGALKSVPTVDTRAVIRSFAGLRAAADGGDFIIESSKVVDGFIHVAGIESPGLSSAPAIGEEVVRILSSCGLELEGKTNWNPHRRPVARFSSMDAVERTAAVAENKAFGKVVCRCETVTEAEIIDAIRRPAGAITLDGVKRRTRAGMGRCQGGFCTPRVVELLARELGISPDAVTKRGMGSNILAGPSKPEICPVRRSDEGNRAALLNRDIHKGLLAISDMPISDMPISDMPISDMPLSDMPLSDKPLSDKPLSDKPLSEYPISGSSSMPPSHISMVVIGGGPAGLAAAIEARKSGIGDVIILEREKEPGGILEQCIHTGFGIHLFGEELTGPEYAQRFIREAAAYGVTILSDTTVLELSQDRQITAVSSRYGYFTVKADAVVLAMGCRERAAGALSIPGARPAGIMTAGSAQRFINMEGYLPGRRVVILGSGDIGLIMARRLMLEGAEVLMVCEVLPYSGGLTRNIVQCLDDFGIPLKCSHTVVALHGKERLTGVTVAKVDEKRNPIPGSGFDVACDTLLLSVGLIPENELSRQAGVILDPATGGPVVSMDMQTGIPGVFACGNVVHVHDLVDHVSEEGRLAGRCAANWLHSGGMMQAADTVDPEPVGTVMTLPGSGTNNPALAGVSTEIPVMAGAGIRYVLPRTLRQNGIQPESRLLFRVLEPGRHVLLEVRAGEKVLLSVRKTRVAPGEMESIPVRKDWLAKVPEGMAVSVRVVPGKQPSASVASSGTTLAASPAAKSRTPVNPGPAGPHEGLNRIRTLVLDMDGTFYLGDHLLETSVGFLDILRETGRQFLFFTNNSSKSPVEYLEKLERMGFGIRPEELMTSGDVAISFLLRERPGKTVFLLGTESLRTQFLTAGIRLLDPAPGWIPRKGTPVADIVMIGFDTSLSYNPLSQACWHIREGAEFLATHLDWNCPVEGGSIPDCGSMCALVEASTGKKARFLGKPCKETMVAVLERTGAQCAEIAFVGDRLYTDVATGVKNGAAGILVLTGETKESDIAGSDIMPTWVFPSLRELGEQIMKGTGC